MARPRLTVLMTALNDPDRQFRITHDFTSHTSLAKRIKYLRLCRGLTQKRLGEKAGVGMAYIHLLERGVGIVNIKRFSRVVRALDCKIRVSVVPLKGHPAVLDTQKIRRDGKINQLRKIRLREEARQLAEQLGYLHPKDALQRKYSARKRALSARRAENFANLMESLLVPDVPPEPPEPSP